LFRLEFQFLLRIFHTYVLRIDQPTKKASHQTLKNRHEGHRMGAVRGIRRIWRLFKVSMIMGIGAVIALIAVGVLYLTSQPDLSIWHTVTLEEEFTAGSHISTFEDYQALETRLFQELEEKVIRQASWEQLDEINRFQPGSVSNPAGWQQNWNRSFLLRSATDRASVLLLHGMSDSPYSLRSIASALHEDGYTVLGLRLPGHGTAPAGLLDITWQDMFAATKLGIRHLHGMSPDRPIYVVGYSNGAALAVLYALKQVRDAQLPKVAGVSILSPAIGITPAAAYARWLIRLGHVLGLQKLAWSSVLPEYDPFKYSSFTVNAGDVTYRLTQQIQLALDSAEADGRLDQVPPIQGFSSVVDATVRPQDLVARLFNRLPENGSELVLFDINRALADTPLFSFDPGPVLDPLTRSQNHRYTLHVVTNAVAKNADVVSETFAPGTSRPDRTPLGLTWPGDVYSLSHIALPFEAGDPLYGTVRQPQVSALQLGAIVLRGEKTVLTVPASDILRIHWNPFHSYLVGQMKAFFNSRMPSSRSSPVR
jgi:alpha-beta hydrolase superfamily lysophospholipase